LKTTFADVNTDGAGLRTDLFQALWMPGEDGRSAGTPAGGQDSAGLMRH